MFHVHHLLRRSSRALALALAFAVVLGSLCPRGWFVCVHDEALVLVDGHHANQAGEVACSERDCCPSGSAGFEEGSGEDGCLDLALSFVLDDQTSSVLVWGTMPSGSLIARLPGLCAAAARRDCSLRRELAGEPPPSPFVSHIRLLV